MSVVTVQRSFPPGQIQSGDPVSRGSRYFPGCTGQGYRVCGALVRGFVPAAVRRYLCGRAAVLLSGGRCRCQRHFLLPGFYRVLCGGRTITANKEAGFVEFWRGGRSHLPCSPPVLLWPLSLLLWLFFGCIGGHTEIVTLPVIGFVRLRAVSCFLFFRRLPQDIAINPVTTPCQKISVTATMARKAVALPRLRFFSLLTAGCTGSFSSSSCALRSSASL